MNKNFYSRFFEDYQPGQTITHAVPRTVTQGDVSLYLAVTGSRFALHSCVELARKVGFRALPIDDILAFHMVFGRTVPDLSLNAIANLGYADCRFLEPVFVGDSLWASSTITGVKENSNGKTGTVYVHSRGWNQDGKTVLEYDRWLMMRKRDPASPAPITVLPKLTDHIDVANLYLPDGINGKEWDCTASGSDALWDDYKIGEKIHHIDGQTIEEAEHQMATRLYQNNARVHFNQHVESHGRFQRRIIYGGHIISLARAISCNGLANAFRVAGINGGRHCAPTFAGDTLYAWSEVIDKMEVPGRKDIGGLRIRTLAAKDHDTMVFPDSKDMTACPFIVLDLDYTLWISRR